MGITWSQVFDEFEKLLEKEFNGAKVILVDNNDDETLYIYDNGKAVVFNKDVIEIRELI